MEGELVKKFSFYKYFCKLGCHFFKWDLRCNGYRCYCGRQHLWAEEISNYG